MASCTCGIERRAHGLDLLHAGALQQVDEHVPGHAHAVQHLALVVMLGRVERPLQVVEHRQQIAQQLALRPVAGLDQLAGRAPAVVVELGPQAEQRSRPECRARATVGVALVAASVARR